VEQQEASSHTNSMEENSNEEESEPVFVIDTDQVVVLEEGNLRRQRQRQWENSSNCSGEEGEGVEVDSRHQASMYTGTAASAYGESTFAMSAVSALSQSAFESIGCDSSIDSQEDCQWSVAM
jgi:hypothetical protein